MVDLPVFISHVNFFYMYFEVVLLGTLLLMVCQDFSNKVTYGGKDNTNTLSTVLDARIPKEDVGSVLAWRIPGMEEPGGLPSMGLHRVGHD